MEMPFIISGKNVKKGFPYIFWPATTASMDWAGNHSSF
jgi:hypothetical protein